MVERWIETWIYRQVKEWIYIYEKVKWVDGLKKVDGKVKGRTDGWMDRWKGESMDG